jgi:hypothetical protein
LLKKALLMINPQNIFQSRITESRIKEADLKKKIEVWTLLRGFSFVLTILATYFFAKYIGDLPAFIAFIICFGVFLSLVSKHIKLKIVLRKAKIFSQVNQNEINRLNNNFKGLSPGIEFIEKDHPYLSDLDLFGSHSLFQLLNRSHTYQGLELLSIWMKNSTGKSMIILRQNAATELAQEIDFRQEFEVTALFSDKIGESPDPLLQWSKTPNNEKIKQQIFRFGRFLPFITLAVGIGAFFDLYSYYFVGVFLLIHGAILKMIDEDISSALKQTETLVDTLLPYSELMQMIENKAFKSELLVKLSQEIDGAPEAVSQLQKIIHFLSYRSNPVAALGGILVMSDLRNFAKLEKWKTENGQKLATWLAVISEFEALNSLAGFQFANPNFANATIEMGNNLLDTKQLGHPLISSENRVYNNFASGGVGNTVILTGSNMSGKSTFERTVGVNIVLALMGAVVCAESFECDEMQLFTSMRTQDSLENDTSSFYAELKRLEKLILSTKSGQNQKPVYYLLDEILKGTNSKDRHTGAKALILQLKEKNTAGIISTHDVELGDEFEGKDFIKNYSFSSEMVDNELVFDYKLKSGVCHSFNASALMRKIGIEVE